jgi:hypothetical protein
VEFRPKERVGFFRLAEREAELSRILGGRRIDLRTPMDLSRYFRDDVLGTAVPCMPNPEAIRRLSPITSTFLNRFSDL